MIVGHCYRHGLLNFWIVSSSTVWPRQQHGRTMASIPMITLCALSMQGYTIGMAVLSWSTLQALVNPWRPQRMSWKTFMIGWEKSQSLLMTSSRSDNTFWKNSHKTSKVAGLLFLLNIQDNRWTKSPLIMSPILEKVGGDDAIRKLIFVTTHWDQIESNLGTAREMQIRLRFRSLLRLGARMDRFDMETETAWRILDPLLRQNIWEEGRMPRLCNE